MVVASCHNNDINFLSIIKFKTFILQLCNPSKYKKKTSSNVHLRCENTSTAYINPLITSPLTFHTIPATNAAFVFYSENEIQKIKVR